MSIEFHPSLYSRDINQQPKIEPNYFSHPDDVRDAVFGAQGRNSIDI